jgi:hypothetical protein
VRSLQGILSQFGDFPPLGAFTAAAFAVKVAAQYANENRVLQKTAPDGPRTRQTEAEAAGGWD